MHAIINELIWFPSLRFRSAFKAKRNMIFYQHSVLLLLRPSFSSNYLANTLWVFVFTTLSIYSIWNYIGFISASVCHEPHSPSLSVKYSSFWVLFRTINTNRKQLVTHFIKSDNSWMFWLASCLLSCFSESLLNTSFSATSYIVSKVVQHDYACVCIELFQLLHSKRRIRWFCLIWKCSHLLLWSLLMIICMSFHSYTSKSLKKKFWLSLNQCVQNA